MEDRIEICLIPLYKFVFNEKEVGIVAIPDNDFDNILQCNNVKDCKAFCNAFTIKVNKEIMDCTYLICFRESYYKKYGKILRSFLHELSHIFLEHLEEEFKEKKITKEVMLKHEKEVENLLDKSMELMKEDLEQLG